jgi:hypothetical protein
MSPFFQDGPAGAEYAFNRDSGDRADVREYCEALWLRYEAFNGDPHFLSDAKANFHARTWEMILTCALIDHDFPVMRPRPDGPDIQIAPHNGAPTVWVEAVTVDLGSGDDHAGRIEYQKVGKSSALFHTQPAKTALGPSWAGPRTSAGFGSRWRRRALRLLRGEARREWAPARRRPSGPARSP